MARSLDYDDDVSIGITLPISLGKRGYFDVSYTTLEQAKSNLKNLLLTSKGERLMQPKFGSDLYRLLFEQIDDDFEDRIRDTIKSDIAYWMPYLHIDEIDVQLDMTGYKETSIPTRTTVVVSVKFSLNTDINEYDIVTFSAVVQGEV